MITWRTAIWLLIGIALGVTQVIGVWRSARHPTERGPLVGLVRMTMVGVMLAISAVVGEILPAATGWAAGFFGSFFALVGKRDKTERRSHIT
jgi:hypothetical protein